MGTHQQSGTHEQSRKVRLKSWTVLVVIILIVVSLRNFWDVQQALQMNQSGVPIMSFLADSSSNNSATVSCNIISPDGSTSFDYKAHATDSAPLNNTPNDGSAANHKEIATVVQHVNQMTTGTLQPTASNVTPNRKYVLHIGPHKTGSTTIQSKMESDDEFIGLMSSDNWTFFAPPHWTARLVGKVFTSVLESKVNTTLFHEGMKEHCQSQTNLVSSNEYLSLATKEQSQSIRQLLFQHCTWDLHIVLVYRRLHTLLPSIWNQIYKFRRRWFRNGMSALQAWEVGIIPKPMKWPTTQSSSVSSLQPSDRTLQIFGEEYWIFSFEEWYTFLHLNNHVQENLHPTKAAYDSWKSLGLQHPYISILNMHDNTRDLITSFACDGLVHANHTCAALSNSSGTKSSKTMKQNHSVNLDYDILAVHAYSVGLINGTRYTRQEAVHAIGKFDETNRKEGNDSMAMLMKCPNSSVLDHLYSWSLESEIWFHSLNQLNDDGTNSSFELTAEQLSGFEEDWENSLDRRLFCAVDTVATVQLKGWNDFFRGQLQ